jgi:spermidine/putrescine ABC transporter ATP-binding subunit
MDNQHPPAVVLENISKWFGSKLAVDHLNLVVQHGELLAILGPSGCGKTTTLRMIAGFERLSEGCLKVSGRDMTSIPAHRRKIGMVFQNYALFPHMDVFENIAFGLKEQKIPKAEIGERVHTALDLVRLKDFEKRKPSQLSGGEQQRVALARALVTEPELLLMDEPLGALDRKLREEMQVELKELLRRVNVTSVFVTHDQEEALAIADRIAVMYAGRLEQVDTPLAIYEAPNSVFCAGFLGTSNIFTGKVSLDMQTRRCTMLTGKGMRLSCPYPHDERQGSDEEQHVMIRPERVDLLPIDDPDPEGFPGEIVTARYLGAVIEYRIVLQNGEQLIARVQQHSTNPLDSLTERRVNVRFPAQFLRWLRQ